VLTIAILTPDFPPGAKSGVGTHVAELATGLSKLGIALVIFTSGRTATSAQFNSSTTVHYIPTPEGALRGSSGDSTPSPVEWNRQVATHAFESLRVHNIKPDLIHCHDFRLFEVALLLREHINVPIISTVHWLNEPCNRRIGQMVTADTIAKEASMCRKSDALITVCRAIEETIIATHGPSVPGITVVYNGVDPHFSNTAKMENDSIPLRRQFAKDSEKIVIFVGRIVPAKGVSGLLRSAMHICSRRDDVVYLIVGEEKKSQYTDTCEMLISNHPGLKRCVRLLGWRDRAELGILYSIANVAVVPSVWDVFPYSAVEAMVSGVATIACNTGGLAEIVEHELSGLLVPVIERPNGVYDVDVPKLADAQARLLNDEMLAGRLSAAGKSRVLETFSYENMLRDTLNVYKRTVANT
jgi:glycosyltransferase involved in cell wall biosynthesis